MAKSREGDLNKFVGRVRGFNRFYTRQIGLLNEGLYGSRFSLTEVRVLFELCRRKETTATVVRSELGLDAGYLSRMLQRFEKGRLIQRRPSNNDGRQHLLSLTAQGRKAFAPLNARATSEVALMLNKLTVSRQQHLVEAMSAVQEILSDPERDSPCVLRRHRPGDMGWVVFRHGQFYNREYGYDERYEALVARIVASFIQHYDPKRERCWIAEKGQDAVGCIFLVKKTKTLAQLRLLFVEPSARGLGLGTLLVNECVRFASEAGYRKIVLWTQSELYAARHIYKKAGFRLVHKKRHRLWGPEQVGETWELVLRRAPRPLQFSHSRFGAHSDR
jgi:DNA-binding MarR family transcriptional regulator/N-acetylglutamate synthase-like GNAT family acetyltransferase